MLGKGVSEEHLPDGTVRALQLLIKGCSLNSSGQALGRGSSNIKSQGSCAVGDPCKGSLAHSTVPHCPTPSEGPRGFGALLSPLISLALAAP